MPNDDTKLKNQAIVAFLGFLTLVVVYSLFWGPARKYADSLTPAKTITTSAEGKAMASPDIAKVSFSVVSEGFNPDKIAEENNKKMNKAIDFAKSQGIEEKDIATSQYNLSPSYEYDEKTRRTFISGYRLTQTALIKIRNLEKTGKILAGLPDLGINQIDSISFDIDEPERYLAEARDKAFSKAREKAGEMASKNGVKLGKVVGFSEYQGGPVVRYQEVKTLDFGGAEPAPVIPQIQPGIQEVIVNVSIIYEIR